MSITAMKTALNALELATTPLAKDRQEVLQAITALRTAIAEAEAQPLEFRQFLSDALTAAGLVEHGKQSKALAERLATGAVRYMAGAQPAPKQEPNIAGFPIKLDPNMAPGQMKIVAAPKQEPVATLHDDGYWTWKGTPPYESSFAGWKMDVYAAPMQAQEQRKPLTDELIEDLRSDANRGFNIDKDDYFKAFRDAEATHNIKEQP